MYITRTECLLEVLEGSKALALGFNMTVLRKLHIPTSPPYIHALTNYPPFCYLHGNSRKHVFVKCRIFHHFTSHISHQS